MPRVPRQNREPEADYHDWASGSEDAVGEEVNRGGLPEGLCIVTGLARFPADRVKLDLIAASGKWPRNERLVLD